MTNPNEVAHAGPRRVRTSDTERDEIARILRAAIGEGRLDLAEGEQRLAAAYAATYRDEFAPLTADLPDPDRHPAAGSPEARSATRRALRRHARFVVSAALLLTALWALSGASFFWPAIPLTFLVIGLIRHARWGGRHPGWAHARRGLPPGTPDRW